MAEKLFDAELKVMGVLWREGEATAKYIASVLAEEVGWNRNTTYTLIKRCIAKGAIAREDPNFRCRPLVSQESVQHAETDALVEKLFDGSSDKLFASLLGRKKVSPDQIRRLKEIVDNLEQEG